MYYNIMYIIVYIYIYKIYIDVIFLFFKLYNEALIKIKTEFHKSEII